MLAGAAACLAAAHSLPRDAHGSSAFHSVLQREQALEAAQQEKAQLRRDLQLMLAARGALASLHASLQHAVAQGPPSIAA